MSHLFVYVMPSEPFQKYNLCAVLKIDLYKKSYFTYKTKKILQYTRQKSRNVSTTNIITSNIECFRDSHEDRCVYSARVTLIKWWDIKNKVKGENREP